MTSASSRVQATSYARAANPETAAAVHASPGEGGATVERKGREARREVFLDFSFANSAGFAFPSSDREASHHAPVAAIRFSITPTQVVARRPIAGIRKNPAAIAPAA